MLTLAIIAVAIAVSLLILGLHGCRADDHPLCRRCGYDLTGRPDASTRCGECGADLTRPRAVRSGHRARRRGPLTAGVVLLVPSLAAVGVAGWSWSHAVDWDRYKPVWWLRHDLRGPAADQLAALAELTRRVTAGTLPADTVTAVADRALATQAGPAPWAPAWGTFVEAVHAAGRLDRPRWATYARQGTAAAMRTRSTIRRGDPMPVSLDFSAARVSAAAFSGLFDLRDVNIDGRPAGTMPHLTPDEFAGHTGKFNVAKGGSGMSYMPPQMGRASGKLALGPHVFGGTFHIDLYDAADLPDGGPDAAPPDASKRLATFDVPTTDRFAVCDNVHAPPMSAVDPAQRAAVVAAVRVLAVTVTTAGEVRASVKLEQPPVRLAFTVSLRPAGGGPEVKFRNLSPRATPGSSCEYADATRWPLGGATHVDVICRPDLKGAADDTDPTPIWGQDVVVPNVAVTRGGK